MREFLQRIFKPFFTWLGTKMSSAPDKQKVHRSLTRLYDSIHKKGKKGTILDTDFNSRKFIIFSDHHKGDRSASDDFANNEVNYLAALSYYHSNQFTYINLGDSEELWKFKPKDVIAKNVQALKAEALFQEGKNYYRTFGNHDLIWKNVIDVKFWLQALFPDPLNVQEGLILRTNIDGKPLSIYLTHGHQGDTMSDNNPVSTWIVAHIWQPIQRYLRININTPAKDFHLAGKHNIMMYEWSASRENLLLITGHTHMPVFASGRYTDHPNNIIAPSEIQTQKHLLKPSYFNSGCCCYNDGDITGIEIAEGMISLIRWKVVDDRPERQLLEEVNLSTLVTDLSSH